MSADGKPRAAESDGDAPLRMRRPKIAAIAGFDPSILDHRALEGAAAHHSQVGAGRLRGEFGAAPLVRTLINWWHVTTDLRVVGSAPATCYSLLLSLDSGSDSRINGHRIATGCLVGYAPSAGLDAVMGANSRFGAIALPPAVLAEAILGPADLTLPAPVDRLVILRPERWAVVELSEFLEDLRGVARSEPELFDDDEWRASVETDALERFGAAVVSACQVPTASPQSRARSAEIVARAEAWLASLRPGSENRRHSVADMCRAVGVRRRTVERAFHDMLGLSPAEHVRLRGLNSARAALAAGGPHASVTRAAVANGFWHFGRFSASYRELFGELPSETLERAGQRPSGK